MVPKYIRPNIAHMAGYTPGEQPAADAKVVKLNTNENPYPPSPKVLEALSRIEPDHLRKYPQPLADTFRDAAGLLHGVRRENIIAGNGSDDILSIALRTFLGPKGALACPDPTYSLYPVLAEMNEVNYIQIPWGKDYTLPVDELCKTNPGAIFFANPNAPTGHMVPFNVVRDLAKSYSGLLLIDEAYADFSGENCIDLVSEFPNVVISRTLSKAYSLAGLRFGYAIARADTIEQMMKVKDSYNCDVVSIKLATAAIMDQDYARQNWHVICIERDRLSTELTQLGWSIIPSRANFLFAQPPKAKSARQIYQALKTQGILVRYFDKPGLDDRLRITVGTPDEDEILLKALRKM